MLHFFLVCGHGIQFRASGRRDIRAIVCVIIFKYKKTLSITMLLLLFTLWARNAIPRYRFGKIF